MAEADSRLTRWEWDAVEEVIFRGEPAAQLARRRGVSPSSVSQTIRSAGRKLGWPRVHVLTLRRLAEEGRIASPSERPPTLTPRQREVLRAVVEGASPAEAAEKLGTSYAAVYRAYHGACRVLGVPHDPVILRRAWRGEE